MSVKVVEDFWANIIWLIYTLPKYCAKNTQWLRGWKQSEQQEVSLRTCAYNSDGRVWYLKPSGKAFVLSILILNIHGFYLELYQVSILKALKGEKGKRTVKCSAYLFIYLLIHLFVLGTVNQTRDLANVPFKWATWRMELVAAWADTLLIF